MVTLRGGFRLFSMAPGLLFMGLIFYMSHKPSVPMPMLFPHQDKVMHFGAYAVLAFLWRIPLRFWPALVLSSLYGISDEIHQAYVPGRQADFLDWLADTAGAAFGAGFFSYLVPRLPASLTRLLVEEK